MSDRDDPWTRWYDGYLAYRAASRAACQTARERRRTANVVAGFLVAYMILGGMAASLAVRLVLAN